MRTQHTTTNSGPRRATARLPGLRVDLVLFPDLSRFPWHPWPTKGHAKSLRAGLIIHTTRSIHCFSKMGRSAAQRLYRRRNVMARRACITGSAKSVAALAHFPVSGQG